MTIRIYIAPGSLWWRALKQLGRRPSKKHSFVLFQVAYHEEITR